MKYAAIREECGEKQYIRRTELGDECKVSGEMCTGKNCPSKLYWSKAHKQPGYYRQRALDKTGLTEAFREEMS